MSDIAKLPIEQRIYLHSELIRHGSLPSCLSCLNQGPYKDDGEKAFYCMKYGQHPPLRVIVEGCPGWEMDIPF